MSEPTTDHLSAFQLDALALDTLPPDEAARYRAHLASCDACRADRDHAAELASHFTRNVLPRTRPRARQRWRLLIAPAFVLAAALGLLIVRGGEPEPEITIKGGATWRVVASRGDAQFAVHDGSVLAAGDHVRFVIIPDGARYLLVASIDGSGAVSMYYPYDGARSGAIAGAQVELPDSIVLDAAPGPERLFALLSDEPIAADDVRDQLRAVGTGGAAAIRAPRQLDVPARAQLTLVFEKVTARD